MIKGLLAKHFWLPIALGLSLASACTMQSQGISRTETGRAMENSKARSAGDALKHAAFSLTRGKSRDAAIETLKNDGASCVKKTCKWVFTLRETTLDTMGVRAPGPKRTYRRTYSVLFVDDYVYSVDSILTNVESEEI